ncbi:MAG: hypothetical protein U1C12_01680 [Patescibacteria group bacterium]|nr:hypothetical protein [Patescibacteria group bacterium]
MKNVLTTLGSVSVAILFGAMIAFAVEETTNEKITLAGIEYTKEEYEVRKMELVAKFKEKTLDVISVREYLEMANKEIKKCGAMAFPSFDSEKTDVLGEINKRIELKKC